MKEIKGRIKRSAISAAVFLALSSGGVVFADNSTGSIYGYAPKGQVVTIKSTATGAQRQITANDSGKFTFGQLPVGTYTVESSGVTKEILVTIGTGSSVNFVSTSAETITVVGSRISAIDVSSVESTTVFTADQIAKLPVGRDITEVALLAPGTVRGDTGFGTLASFGGSSVAENGYYINGFDVTNIRDFLSYAELPFDAIAQQQVKTGGYGAEYGRSLGGVINLVTKSGSNVWNGGVAAYWSPESGRERSANVLSIDPRDYNTDGSYAASSFVAYRDKSTDDLLSYNVHVGGPLIEDRLFVFAMVEGKKNEWERFGSQTSTRNSADSPSYLVKVDWNIADDHKMEFTAIENEDVTDTTPYTNTLKADGSTDYYNGQHGIAGADFSVTNGGKIYIAKYTGHLTDSFTMSAMFGRLENITAYRTPEGATDPNCPRVWDSRTSTSALVYAGCWDQSLPVVDRQAGFGPDTDERDAIRLDFEWLMGDHTFRFGYDDEVFTSRHAGTNYIGPTGLYYRLYRTGATSRSVNGVTVAPNTDYFRTWYRPTAGGEYEIHNSAGYIEDSWQVSDDWLVYLGVRSEAFNNQNGDGETFVSASDSIAPRLGFSWDVHGDSSMKVYANAGRYFIPVAANTNFRASAAELFEVRYFYYSGNLDPVNAIPQGIGAEIGSPNVTGSLVAPNPLTVADVNLDPMYQDEFIVGVQQKFSDLWSLGGRFIYRDVKNGMEDFCSHQGFEDWALDNGYTNFDTATMAECMIINPGKSVSLGMDLQNDGNITVATIPNSYFQLPDYKRTYTAVELYWERGKSDGWYLQGSYTLAKSEGNIEGYVNSTLEQDDPGLTQDFDHYVFQQGADGYLPNDRRHTVKLFGAYDISDEFYVSGNLLVQSGRPVNCNGYVPQSLRPQLGQDTGLYNYGASTFYCPDENGNDVLRQRGDEGRTPWQYTFDLGVAYVPSWADNNLTIKLDIRNLFNAQEVTEYVEASQQGGGSSPEAELNFKQPINYQAPRNMRLTVRYSF